MGISHPSSFYSESKLKSLIFSVLGEEFWLSTDEETDRNWAVINGLVPGVIYEMRVVARAGTEDEGVETPSPVRRVRIGVRRGRFTVNELID